MYSNKLHIYIKHKGHCCVFLFLFFLTYNCTVPEEKERKKDLKPRKSALESGMVFGEAFTAQKHKRKILQNCGPYTGVVSLVKLYQCSLSLFRCSRCSHSISSNAALSTSSTVANGLCSYLQEQPMFSVSVPASAAHDLCQSLVPLTFFVNSCK